MKIILSRKSFDSANGGMPSPIIDGKVFLPFPIPSKTDSVRYDSLTYLDKSYTDILRDLNKYFSEQTCHLDPDLKKDVILGRSSWIAAFGQEDIAQRHLEKHKVKENDLFLFFGWFREAKEIGGIYRFKDNAPDIHAIYGYLEVGTIIKNQDTMKKFLPDHPHSTGIHKQPNCLYIAAPTLFGEPGIPGAGIFPFHEDLILTELDKNKLPNNKILRSRWRKNFLNINGFSMTYHTNASIDNYFQSTARGQEFIIEPRPYEEFDDQALTKFKNWIISRIRNE